MKKSQEYILLWCFILGAVGYMCFQVLQHGGEKAPFAIFFLVPVLLVFLASLKWQVVTTGIGIPLALYLGVLMIMSTGNSDSGLYEDIMVYAVLAAVFGRLLVLFLRMLPRKPE